MSEIQARQKAVADTLKRFDGKPFDWATSGTCIHLLRYHAAKMGHNLPVVPRFRSAHGAMKALKETGHGSLGELLDAYFIPIAPAFMRLGDVMLLPSGDIFDAIVVRASVTKYIGWHETVEGCCIIDADMSAAIGAWRL